MRRPPLWAAVFLVCGLPAAAQQGGAPAAPDRFETARLVWTTLISIDRANRTGNYSVFRDLAAPGFRKRNDPAELAAIFAGVRRQDIGLGRVVQAAPVYSEPPTVPASGMFRVIGAFPARPVGVAFDLLFENVDGQWRLFGVSVGEAPADGSEDAIARPVAKPAR